MSSSEVTITAPPGRLGIQLMDYENKTVVSLVSPKSPLNGKVFQGDSIALINGVDVHGLNASGILDTCNKFSNVKKIITVVRCTPDKVQDSVESSSALSGYQSQSKSSSSCEGEHRHHHDRNTSRKTSSSKKERKNDVLKHSVPSGEEVMRGTVERVSDYGRHPLPLDFCDDSDCAKALSLNAKPNVLKGNKCTLSVINSLEDDSPDDPLSKISHTKPKLLTRLSGPSEHYLLGSPPVPVGAVFDDSISTRASTKTKLSLSAPLSKERLPCSIKRRSHHPTEMSCNSPCAACEESQGQSSQSITRSNANHPTNNVPALTAPLEQSMTYCPRSPSSIECMGTERSANQNEMDHNTEEVIADAILVSEDETIYDAEAVHDQSLHRNEWKTPQVVINQKYYHPDEEFSCFQNKLFVPAVVIILMIAGVSIIAGIIAGVKRPTSNTYDVHTIDSHNSLDDHSLNSDLTYNSTTNQYYFSNGSRYEGPNPSGSSHETVISTPVPVSGNEKCENAITLTNLPALFTGTTTTDSWSDDSYFDDNQCRTSDGLKGVWYSFKSDKLQIISVEYDLKPDNPYDYYDSVLSVFTGSCGVSNLNCINTVVGSAISELELAVFDELREVASHDFIAREGELYLFLLSGDNSNGSGKYTFRVEEFDVPSNDRCLDATTITSFPQVFRGNMKGATEDDNAAYFCIYRSRGVWYQFTGNGTIVRLEYHQPEVVFEGNGITIVAGTCDSIQNCLGDEEMVVYESSHFTAREFFAEKGQPYLVYVYTELFEYSGQFQFNVTEYEVPINDNCAGAAEVIVSPSNPFSHIGHTTLGATPDDALPSCDLYGSEWSSVQRGLWYKIIGNGSEMMIEYQLYSEATGQSELRLFTGSCESLSCYDELHGSAHYDWGPNDKISYELVAEKGQTYWIWISGENAQTVGEYDFIVSEL